jgi:hypothetical protein
MARAGEQHSVAMEIEAILFVGFVVIVVIGATLGITVSARRAGGPKCPGCGGENPHAAQFCRRCGMKLKQ